MYKTFSTAKRAILAVIAAVVAAAGFSGCGILSEKGKLQRFSDMYYDCFDTVIAVTAYCGDQQEFDELSSRIHDKFIYYHKLFDIYNEYEGLNNAFTVNKAAGSGEDIQVDPDLADLVYLGMYMRKHTKDSVNIAMGAVLKLWHEAREISINDPSKAYIPEEEALKEAAQHCDHNNVVFDLEKSTVRLDDPEMSLDLGSIGKGYAVKKVSEWLAAEGKTGILINAGGNVHAVGSKPASRNALFKKASDEPWTVAVEDPSEGKEGTYADQLLLKDRCLVTSGVNQRYYEYEGTRYHHIIDQSTLHPENRYLSVSVIYTDSACADCLSTALFNMDLDESRAFVEADPDLEALWILPDGSRVESGGWASYRK